MLQNSIALTYFLQFSLITFLFFDWRRQTQNLQFLLILSRVFKTFYENIFYHFNSYGQFPLLPGSAAYFISFCFYPCSFLIKGQKLHIASMKLSKYWEKQKGCQMLKNKKMNESQVTLIKAFLSLNPNGSNIK